MTVNDIVGPVLLRVTGGKPTADSSVHAADIKSLIPDAINLMMGTRIDKEYAEEASVHPNGLFVNTYDDINVTTNSRGLATIKFPKRPLTVRGAKSVVAIGEVGGRIFTRVYHDEGTLGAFYWKTKTDTPTYDVEGMNAVFYNLPLSVTKVYAKLVVHIDALDYDDEINIPSGMEGAVIDILYDMMMNQRATPKDKVIDGREDIA